LRLLNESHRDDRVTKAIIAAEDPASHQRSLIADGQPVVLEIVITEIKDPSKRLEKSRNLAAIGDWASQCPHGTYQTRNSDRDHFLSAAIGTQNRVRVTPHVACLRCRVNFK
jgi:hypothetical protein